MDVLIVRSLGVVFSSIRFEVITRYQYSQIMNADSWSSIFGSLFSLLVIPVCIVVARAVHTMTIYHSVPFHVVKMQIGRVLFFFSLAATTVMMYFIAVGKADLSDRLAMAPFILGWLCSIPLIIQRIQGVFFPFICLIRSLTHSQFTGISRIMNRRTTTIGCFSGRHLC